jgi:orotate phosphoribosyltransferase
MIGRSGGIAALVTRAIGIELWSMGAIRISGGDPFRLASGNYSPIYINTRLLIGSPIFARMFVAGARTVLPPAHTFHRIAGGETAGIPFAAFLAFDYAKPLLYVRKQPKEHGLRGRIEGPLIERDRVLLVEDLITDAASKLSFIHALRAEGGIVEDVLVVFDRGQGGAKALEDEGVTLYALTNMTTVLRVGTDEGHISSAQTEAISRYLASPEEWHSERGLPYVPTART